MTRPPLPPFSRESAVEKVRLAEDGWNGRNPEKVSLAYTQDTVWRNRAEFVNGRSEVVAFLTRKWAKELDYRLIKELWAFSENRIAVRYAYEWHDDSGNWFRSYGNENWEFAPDGLMHRRFACINDLPIAEADRKFHWPLGRRPDDHPSLSELGLQPPLISWRGHDDAWRTAVQPRVSPARSLVMPLVRNADAVLHYDVVGEGEPLLILPGLAMDIGPWRPLASMLVGFKIVLIDNRDAGGSSTTAQQYALSDMSADVRAVLDDLGLEQVSILGHSLGGQIAQEFALRDPNRVRKLILANSWARTDQYLANKFETWRILKRHLPDAHFREVMTFNLSHPDVLASAPLHAITALTNPLFHDQSADAFCRGANAASQADTLDRLTGLVSPTLVISGERDVVLPAPYSDELTNAIPKATRIRLETAGHAAPWEASEIFVNEVRSFLKRPA